jgi:hypothetical protein
MEANGRSRSLEIRQQLSHPILDADGHWLEFEPAVFDYLKDVAGADEKCAYGGNVIPAKARRIQAPITTSNAAEFAAIRKEQPSRGMTHRDGV